jgi:hypothetical protein
LEGAELVSKLENRDGRLRGQGDDRAYADSAGKLLVLPDGDSILEWFGGDLQHSDPSGNASEVTE